MRWAVDQSLDGEVKNSHFFSFTSYSPNHLDWSTVSLFIFKSVSPFHDLKLGIHKGIKLHFYPSLLA